MKSFVRNLQIFVISQSVCPWQALPAQFVCKSRTPTLECRTQAGSMLTCKHQTRLERLARDKHSSLLRTFVNYGRKSFIILGPRNAMKSFVRNLQIFVISQSVCPWQALPAQFVGKSRTPTLECRTQAGSMLTCKHQTRLERLARDKHSSLLRQFVN